MFTLTRAKKCNISFFLFRAAAVLNLIRKKFTILWKEISDRRYLTPNAFSSFPRMHRTPAFMVDLNNNAKFNCDLRFSLFDACALTRFSTSFLAAFGTTRRQWVSHTICESNFAVAIRHLYLEEVITVNVKTNNFYNKNKFQMSLRQK